MSQTNKVVDINEPLIGESYRPEGGERYNPKNRPLESDGGDGLTR